MDEIPAMIAIVPVRVCDNQADLCRIAPCGAAAAGREFAFARRPFPVRVWRASLVAADFPGIPLSKSVGRLARSAAMSWSRFLSARVGRCPFVETCT
jgi:hypothetical protein